MRLALSCVRSTLVLLAVVSSACGSPEQAAPAVSADETRYLEAARPFMQALVAQDQGKAYGLASTHLRAQLTQDEFTRKNREAYDTLGAPLALEDLSAETDPDVLVGAAHAGGDDAGDRAANVVLAQIAVGDMPDDIPASVRKASVSGRVVYKKASSADEEDASYVLTVVLVDDGGALRVGHHFFRAATMLDD